MGSPAYSGKRKSNVYDATIVENHPRLCGEKCELLCCQPGDIGSPPPMRGKVRTGDRTLALSQDHPRLCGEKSLRSR